ncbi:extracellular calcium-sensing receptor-like [Protopterus annectens]|uniref:extracellular calcium-sensing receptor-like n=1 Tax=Protopterus annectens TaxID=7888 RepID=UPI001CF9A2D9|nr:extracellular calcium-sensing receptor-like [Protopterus annectens]
MDYSCSYGTNGLSKEKQISYGSTVALLSDKLQFPSFIRTIPSDYFLFYSIAQLVITFDWTWVGLISEDTDYGRSGSQTLMQQLVTSARCIAFSETIPATFSMTKIQNIVSVIKESSTKVIVIVASDLMVIPLMEELLQQNVTEKVWIATEGWAPTPMFLRKDLSNVLNLTIAFGVHKAEMPGFKTFLLNIHPSDSHNYIFVDSFWKEIFGCQWPHYNRSAEPYASYFNDSNICTGKETLSANGIEFFNGNDLRYEYNVYKAIYAVGYGLQNMLMCISEGIRINGSCGNISDFKAWQLHHHVKNVHFQTSAGEEMYFDVNGNPPPIYDIINCQLSYNEPPRYIEVGKYDATSSPGQEFSINESLILWSGGSSKVPKSVCSESCSTGYRKANMEGKPICCFLCIPCSEGEISNVSGSSECQKCQVDYWPNQRRDRCILKETEFLSYEELLGATLTITACISAILPLSVLVIFIKNHDTPVVKANNRELSYLLLLALILCFLSSLIFIGQPTTVGCIMQQAAFGIIFTFCIACVLAKTIMVVIAFKATKPGSSLRKWVGQKLPNTIILVCVTLQIVICVVWYSSARPYLEKNTTSYLNKIVIGCNEGSAPAFWGMLGYLGVLASISFVVAFLARKLPASFNEAQLITFSMIIFVCVWLAFIPAYLTTKGKFTVAVEIFAILTSSYGLLYCIFFPKCYIILLKPNKNKKHNLLAN